MNSISEIVDQVLEGSKRLNKSLRAEMRQREKYKADPDKYPGKNKTHPQFSGRVLDQLDRHDNLLTMLEELHGGGNQAEALKFAKDKYPDLVKSDFTHAQATAAINNAVSDLTNDLNQTHNGRRIIDRSHKGVIGSNAETEIVDLTKAPKLQMQPSEAVEEAGAKGVGKFMNRIGGSISGMFQAHQNKLNSMSQGGRIAVSAAYIGLGSAIMATGERLLGAAVSGHTEKQASHVDAKGRSITTFVQVPLPAATRSVQGTIGSAAMLAGAVLNGVGLYNLFCSP